ncbi:MAG: hypothetical protein LBU70_00500 [Chitinispirillales bacterium]|nr:hypothetical protein [Chitinispirillales bacterium]
MNKHILTDLTGKPVTVTVSSRGIMSIKQKDGTHRTKLSDNLAKHFLKQLKEIREESAKSGRSTSEPNI